jgi:outer membrane protein assembly factor BamA
MSKQQKLIRRVYPIYMLLILFGVGILFKIGQVQFLGDKKIKDGKLKNIITSEESRFWKFLSQSVYLNYEQNFLYSQ